MYSWNYNVFTYNLLILNTTFWFCTVFVHLLTSTLYQNVEQVIHVLAGCRGNLKRTDNKVERRKNSSRFWNLKIDLYVVTLFCISILKDAAAENCSRRNVRHVLSCAISVHDFKLWWRASDLWNIVDVQVAALFHSVLIAGRLFCLGRLSNKGGGLKDEGRLGRRRLEEKARWRKNSQKWMIPKSVCNQDRLKQTSPSPLVASQHWYLIKGSVGDVVVGWSPWRDPVLRGASQEILRIQLRFSLVL